jgi:CRP-like cAMP-binding protein
VGAARDGQATGQMQLDDATTILGRADFFTICDAEQRRLLAFASERKRWRPGEILYKSGDVTEGAHVLVRGTLATYQQDDESNPFLVAEAGSVIGAISLVIAKPRAITVKAVDHAETLFVPRSAFLKLAAQTPDLAARAADRIRAELVDYLGAVEKMRSRVTSSS